MATLPLIKTIDYSTVADTPAVAAGQYLLPGQIDAKGGVWKVLNHQLVGTSAATTAEDDSFLYFDSFASLTNAKIVVTGTTSGNDVFGAVKIDPAGKIFYYGGLTPSFNVALARKPVPGNTHFFNQTAPVPSYVTGHVYQSVIECLAGGRLTCAIFDMTAPGTGQPADPINVTDAGSVNSFLGATDAYPSPIVSGYFGIPVQSQNSITAVSKVRLYSNLFTGQTDNGKTLMTGSAGSVLANRQSVYLTGNGWTVGSQSTFTGTFTPTAGDSGTAPSLVSQLVSSVNTAVIIVTGGTAQGVYTVTDTVSGTTLALTIATGLPKFFTSAGVPAIVTGGSITAKTFLGPDLSVKMDGSDDTVAYQRFIDTLVRYSLMGYQEKGDVLISRPIVIRQPESDIATPGHYSYGLKLEGLCGQSYVPSQGCNVIMTGTGARAVLEMGPHYMNCTSIKHISFFGNNTSNDTARVIYSPVHHWSQWTFEECSFAWADVGVDIDNQAIVTPYSDHGPNGESLKLIRCAMGGRRICYRNASSSGQAYTHSLRDCNGGAEVNGGTFVQVGSIAGGGIELDISGQSLSMKPGPLPNTFIETTNAIENINCFGGRIESTQCAVKYAVPGYASAGIINIQGVTFTEVTSSNNYNLIEASNNGTSNVLMNISNCTFQSGTQGVNDGKLHLRFGGSTDDTKVIFDNNTLEYVDVVALNSNNVIARTNRMANSATYAAGFSGPLTSDNYKGVSQAALTTALATAAPAQAEVYLGITDTQALAGVDAEVFTSVTLKKRVNFTLFGRTYNLEKGQTVSLPATVVSILTQALAV